jgi:hypothetical protein
MNLLVTLLPETFLADCGTYRAEGSIVIGDDGGNDLAAVSTGSVGANSEGRKGHESLGESHLGASGESLRRAKVV